MEQHYIAFKFTYPGTNHEIEGKSKIAGQKWYIDDLVTILNEMYGEGSHWAVLAEVKEAA
jgi:hypothetical protein